MGPVGQGAAWLTGHCGGAGGYRRLRGMSETTLYPSVKRFLEAAGFRVKGEVEGCDVVAVRDDEPLQLTVVEMKLGFSLELLLQAVDRMRAADEVWLAVPASLNFSNAAGASGLRI